MNINSTRLCIGGLFIAWLSVAFPWALLAQRSNLVGTVTDAATGETIPGVSVLLVGTNQGTATGADGRYTIVGISPGLYDIRFSFVGYVTQVIDGIRITYAFTQMDLLNNVNRLTLRVGM